MNTIEAQKGFRTFLILAGILGLCFGTYKTVPHYLTRARTSEKPKNSQVRNLAASSIVIAWETEVETQGFVAYGTEPQEIIRVAPEAQKTKAHEVTIENLTPETTYYYKIGSGEKVFGDTPFQFTTPKE